MTKVKAAGVFLIRKDDKILICHPTNHKPTMWSIPKGKLDGDETALSAAIRETFEETNIDLSEHKIMIELEPVNYGHKKKILYPFIIHEHVNTHLNWDSWVIKCNSNVPEERGGFPEMDDYKWVTISEARTLLHETQVACLDDIEAFIHSEEYTKKNW